MATDENGNWKPDYEATQWTDKEGNPISHESDSVTAGHAAGIRVGTARHDIDPLRYYADPTAWDYTEGEIDPYYKDQMAKVRGMKYDDTYDQQARDMEQQRRKQYQEYLAQVAQYASGQRSDIRDQQPLMQQQLNQQMSSRLASTRGEYDPAAVMASQQARSEGLRQMGAQARVGQAEEQQTAQQNYAKAVQEGQQQDLMAMQAESQRAQAMNAWLQQQSAQEQEWYKQGLMDKIARAEAQQAYERLLQDTADYDIEFAREQMQTELGD